MIDREIYGMVLLVITTTGWIIGVIRLSVLHHLGKELHEEDIGRTVILPIFAGAAWPFVVLTPLVGLGYLAHKGIGLVVKPKCMLANAPIDPTLVAAKREVEEICSETPS
ncbi:hypothetical protein LCGC14_2225090 [marine sediment metagenome]|uniref:Uncharacterized protein n=1 Tax=marine sediment metagenome TaxID=412755 RepID=A0A0F9D9X8_9ZZZZ